MNYISLRRIIICYKSTKRTNFFHKLAGETAHDSFFIILAAFYGIESMNHGRCYSTATITMPLQKERAGAILGRRTGSRYPSTTRTADNHIKGLIVKFAELHG